MANWTAPVCVLSAGLPPGEDQAHFNLPRLADNKSSGAHGTCARADAPAAAALAQQPQTIESIRVIGNRRIPKETVLARLFTHVGDSFDPVSIERDFNSLWNTSYFDDVRIEREDSEKGIILNIFVRERPNIREINYKGLNAVSQSDVLDRFKKEKVGLSVESQYDPTKIKRAETVLKECSPSTATSLPPSRPRSRPFRRPACRLISTSRKAPP